MKDKEKKNKKHHESTIGKIIYGFLLFLPLLAIGVTCGYAIFNKNAYQSFASEEENLSYKEVNYTELQYGTTYTLQFSNSSSFTGSINYLGTGINYINYLGQEIDLTNYNRFRFYSNTSLACFSDTLETKYVTITNVPSITFIFTGTSENNSFVPSNIKYFENLKQTPVKDINNAFYYSIDKVTQSNLFNWTQNTSIYSTINQFTNNLGITNTFIPLLLTYWLIISIVYFLYDIVLMILVVLHRKIHELQDTI